MDSAAAGTASSEGAQGPVGPSPRTASPRPLPQLGVTCRPRTGRDSHRELAQVPELDWAGGTRGRDRPPADQEPHLPRPAPPRQAAAAHLRPSRGLGTCAHLP